MVFLGFLPSSHPVRISFQRPNPQSLSHGAAFHLEDDDTLEDGFECGREYKKTRARSLLFWDLGVLFIKFIKRI